MSEVIYYIGNSINSFPEIFNFIKNDNPNIISFLNSTIPSTPVSLFENFFKTNFIANGTQYARDFSSNDYPGIEATTELKNKIISHGIVEEFEGNDVWPEMSVFDRSFSTNGINEPIKTYAPINLENIDVDARFLNFRDNSLTLRIPVSELEINMLVQFSGMIGNLDIGLAPELLNGLYRITNISSSSDDPGFQIITFISSRSLFAEIRFLNYPIYTEAKVNIIPQCFKITTISRDIALIGSSTRIDCSIVKLQGFSAVGGLSANQLNSRFSVYSQINNESAFLILPTGVIASETTTGGISGNLLVCTFPDNEVINNSLLQNRFTQKNTPSPSTVFFINKPILLNCWSQVEISGFVGEYSRLNGIFQAHISNFNVFDSNITPEIWKEGYYIPNRKYSCAIDVSSDGLPSFNPLTHTRNKKNFTIKRIVNKLEGSSIYSDFADACGYLVK
jgi:hypothetical protein